jgi:thiamine transporter ThiT
MRLFSGHSPILLVSRVALAFSWIYQGLVPKIVCRSPGEIRLLEPVVPVFQLACTLVEWMGYGELLFGVLLLVLQKRWVFHLNILLLLVLLAYVALVEPGMFTLPFNPLTLNVALIALSLVALIELKQEEKM